MSHPFGELLKLYRARTHGLSQAKLAQILGYDPSVIARMAKGQKDLTGPTGREKVVRISATLRDEGVLHMLDEANALLAAADMPPLYEGLPAEAALIASLPPASAPTPELVPTPAAHPGIPHNLPAHLTSFIGREQDIAELTDCMQTERLITLIGSGGVGKSRLAQQVALDVISHFPEHVAYGAWLVQLAPINEPALVADATAYTLGLRPAGRPAKDVLIGHLRSQRILLVLDNCEHLIHACAELAEALLQACPHLHILATSRELLNIAGETTWRVPSLAVETAVQLFVDRARAARPDFKLNEQNTGHIARICERLDGIPLAIELAAAKLRAFSVEQIAARLDDRFQLLTDGSRTALPRHQTLRALIDWSYGLLTTHERVLLRQVSVFAGGWTLEAAEAVCRNTARHHDIPDLLARLVNKSLVTMNETPTGARYSLHETIRQYAHEKLMDVGEEERTRQRHLDFFTCMAEEAKAHMRQWGQECREWLDRIQADNDNFRVALERVAQAHDVATGERLIDPLCFFWEMRYHPIEGIDWINRVLISPSSPGERAYAVGRTRAGYLSIMAGRHEQATAWLEEAMPLVQALGDRELLIHATRAFGFIIQDYEQSIELEWEAIRLAEKLGWVEETPLCLFMIGRRMHLQRDYEGATRVLMDGVRLSRERRTSDVGYCLRELGLIASEQGDCAQARSLFEESIVVGREWDEPNVIAGSQLGLAEVALREQREDEVMRLIKECITVLQKWGDQYRVARCLSVAAGVAQACGQLALAVRWLGVASIVWRDFSGHNWAKSAVYAEYEHRLAALREVVAPANFERAWAEGERMTLAQAVDEVVAMNEE